jgi:hypothetical protein
MKLLKNKIKFMNKKYCVVCQKLIPEGRIKLGYSTTCVNHSTAERYTGIVAAGSKNDFEVHVIKDSKVAKELVKMSGVY